MSFVVLSLDLNPDCKICGEMVKVKPALFFFEKAGSRECVLRCAGVAHVQGQNSCCQEVRTAVLVWSYFNLCNTFHETVTASPCGHALFGQISHSSADSTKSTFVLFIVSHKFSFLYVEND